MSIKNSNIRAVALFSGGLDSCLAIKLIVLQNIDVIALYFNMPFTVNKHPVELMNRDVPSPLDTLRQRAEQAGGRFVVYSTGADYIDMLKAPCYGYGRNMNPCIDCKIFFYKHAHEIMKEEGAQFLVTGEVLGQRPMTQNKQMLMAMAKRAGVEGLVLRPLSARLLPVTIPEEKGWVDRAQLLDIQGRTRRLQLDLAAEWGISDFPNPAGGCLLTDPTYSRRLKDLFEHDINELNDIVLLKYGRHFRLSETVKLVVGRDEADNHALSGLVQEGDILLEVPAFGSPLCILRGEGADALLPFAARVCKRYSSGKSVDRVEVRVLKTGEEEPRAIMVEGELDETELKAFMLQ